MSGFLANTYWLYPKKNMINIKNRLLKRKEPINVFIDSSGNKFPLYKVDFNTLIKLY
jgi:hypothetical protein